MKKSPFTIKNLRKVAELANKDQRELMKKAIITIPIQTKWLETLLKLSEQAQKDINKWYESTTPLMPKSISRLVGYTGSVETILCIKGLEKHQEEAEFIENNL